MIMEWRGNYQGHSEGTWWLTGKIQATGAIIIIIDKRTAHVDSLSVNYTSFVHIYFSPFNKRLRSEREPG